MFLLWLLILSYCILTKFNFPYICYVPDKGVGRKAHNFQIQLRFYSMLPNNYCRYRQNHMLQSHIVTRSFKIDSSAIDSAKRLATRFLSHKMQRFLNKFALKNYNSCVSWKLRFITRLKGYLLQVVVVTHSLTQMAYLLCCYFSLIKTLMVVCSEGSLQFTKHLYSFKVLVNLTVSCRRGHIMRQYTLKSNIMGENIFSHCVNYEKWYFIFSSCCACFTMMTTIKHFPVKNDVPDNVISASFYHQHSERLPLVFDSPSYCLQVNLSKAAVSHTPTHTHTLLEFLEYKQCVFFFPFRWAVLLAGLITKCLACSHGEADVG